MPLRIRSTITWVLPTIAAAYGILYGIRYTHNIFPLSNLLFLWLAVLASGLWADGLNEVVVGKRRVSAPPRRVASTVPVSEENRR